MVHIDVVKLGVGDHNVVAFHGDFGKPGVFKRENRCQKERVDQVSIIVQKLHLHSQVPCKLSLDDRKALTVSSP